MSIIRPMTNDDLLAYKHLCSICYTYTDTDQPAQLTEEQLRIRMGAFDEEGRLLSAMMQIPFDVRFGGQTVKLVGIGGVVTDPTARGQRGVRRLFEEGLPRLYREGYVLSALYPFSHRFYRKFGYEWAQFWQNVELPRNSLRRDLQQADEIVRVLPEEDDQGMQSIYEAYVADKHLPVLRDEHKWKELRKGTPWDSLKHAYVLRVGGKPVSYWIGTMHKEDWRCTLYIKEMAWTCQRGLEAIFAMLRGMNELEGIRVRVQGDCDPRLLLEEPYDVSWKDTCEGMMRVVNVERALVLLAAPPLPGTLSIAVTDEQIAENCGCFTVSCDGYQLSVTRDDAAQPDLRCDIQGLSALMAGRQTFDHCEHAGTVTLLNEKRRRFAGMLFPKRDLHMNQDF